MENGNKPKRKFRQIRLTLVLIINLSWIVGHRTSKNDYSIWIKEMKKVKSDEK